MEYETTGMTIKLAEVQFEHHSFSNCNELENCNQTTKM